MELPWIIKEPTKIKHQLLRSYIGKWMGILFAQQARIGKPEILLYFDGFSGPGIYWKDENKNSTCPGSPIIVGEIANKFIESKRSSV